MIISEPTISTPLAKSNGTFFFNRAFDVFKKYSIFPKFSGLYLQVFINQCVISYADWSNIGASVTPQSDASMHFSDFKMLKKYMVRW